MQSKKYSERGWWREILSPKGTEDAPSGLSLRSLTAKVFTPVEDVSARVDKSQQVPEKFWLPINHFVRSSLLS